MFPSPVSCDGLFLLSLKFPSTSRKYIFFIIIIYPNPDSSLWADFTQRSLLLSCRPVFPESLHLYLILLLEYKIIHCHTSLCLQCFLYLMDQKAENFTPQPVLAVKSRCNRGFANEMYSPEAGQWKGGGPVLFSVGVGWGTFSSSGSVFSDQDSWSGSQIWRCGAVVTARVVFLQLPQLRDGRLQEKSEASPWPQFLVPAFLPTILWPFISLF